MGLTINFSDQEKGVQLPEAYIRIMNYTGQHKISCSFTIGIFANKAALSPYATREFYINRDQQMIDPQYENSQGQNQTQQADSGEIPMRVPFKEFFSLEELSKEGINPENAIYRYLKAFQYPDAQDVFESGQIETSPQQEEPQPQEAQ